ncbi:MAG: bifunctional diaminohydroxyphosphoribosylaminopyrimidine deaminase/5-amino-6-(5-phosphoribosylamino)uracil reductase RibD [Gammaproteobacteria bacterium]
MHNLLSSIFLIHALSLAESRRGFCAPNPSVGAVVVKEGRVIGSGCHWAAGHPHAEVAALAGLTPNETAGATLYVTLEPCCHWGKTPPCTDLIIQHKIHQVIYGYQDPNPIVSGKGHQLLLEAGVPCIHVALPEIDTFYVSYAHWVKTGRPYVTAKLALSLDGCIAGKNGEPVAITGPVAQQFTHQQRLRADAILTTSRTICQDDPQLNIRLDNQPIISKTIYILDRHKKVPLSARIFKTGAPVILLQDDIKLPEILDKIGQDGIQDLFVEAGGTCFSQLVKEHLVQRAFILVAPKWLNGQRAFEGDNDILSHTVQRVWKILGEDALCEVKYVYGDY